MKHHKIIKIVAALLCCGLCISSAALGIMAVKKMPEINGQTAYADGHVYWFDPTGEFEIQEINESFFAPGNLNNPNAQNNKYFKYNQKALDWLLPGGSKSGKLTVKNNSESADAYMSFCADHTGIMRWRADHRDYDQMDESLFDEYGFYKGYLPKEYEDFQAQNKTGNAAYDYTPQQLFYISKILVEKKLLLKVYKLSPYQEGKGRLVYKGNVKGHGNYYNEYSDDDFNTEPWYNITVPAEEDEDWNFTVNSDDPITDDMTIELGKVYPGESATFLFRLHAPTDLHSFFTEADGSIYAGFVEASKTGSNSGSGGASQNDTGVYGASPIDTNADPEPPEPNHGYSNTVAMIDWIFEIYTLGAPSYESEPESEPESDPEPTKPEPTKPEPTKPEPTKPAPIVPGTGEAAVPYAFASGFCGFSALVIFFIAFGNTGKRKKEEE